jgi:hypothetical protein
VIEARKLKHASRCESIREAKPRGRAKSLKILNAISLDGKTGDLLVDSRFLAS